MPNAIDLTGVKRHKLTALYKVGKNKQGGWDWMFKCDCGNEKIYSTSQFSRVQSCGCAQPENAVKSLGREYHKKTKTKEHKIWLGMISRCSGKSYANEIYKNKGIKVCERWKNSFNAFLKDMGECPQNHSIDRIDNNGDYEPSNCRWATDDIQMNNRDVTVYVEHNGNKLPLAEVCKNLNLNRHTVWGRLKKGYSIEDALKQPKDVERITVEGITRTVADWGLVLGYTRTSSYRLHREGKLLRKIQHLLWHKH